MPTQEHPLDSNVYDIIMLAIFWLFPRQQLVDVNVNTQTVYWNNIMIMNRYGASSDDGFREIDNLSLIHPLSSLARLLHWNLLGKANSQMKMHLPLDCFAGGFKCLCFFLFPLNITHVSWSSSLLERSDEASPNLSGLPLCQASQYASIAGSPFVLAPCQTALVGLRAMDREYEYFFCCYARTGWGCYLVKIKCWYTFEICVGIRWHQYVVPVVPVILSL